MGTCVRAREKQKLIVCNMVIMAGKQRQEFGDIWESQGGVPVHGIFEHGLDC